MSRYIVQRLALVPVVLFLLSSIVFWSIRAIPGDVVSVRLENSYTPERAAALRHQLRLDEPWWQQQPRWLAGLLRGDLGRSFITDRPITREIQQRLPVTAELVIASMLVTVLIGIPVGVLAATQFGRPLDHLIRLLSILLLAVPSFWVATLILIIPSILWRWSPPFGYVSILKSPGKNLQQFAAPVLIMGLFLAAIILRLVRAQLLEILRQEYITTARAKGLAFRVVLRRHALKNTLLPVITVFGLAFANAVGGAVIIETIFSLPGLGSYGVDAVQRRDYTAVQGFTLTVGFIYIAVNLLVDLSYAYIDPRIRFK